MDARALDQCEPQVGHGACVERVVAMGKVESRDVHAGVQELPEHLDGPTTRPDGANDLGLADTADGRRPTQDLLERDADAVDLAETTSDHGEGQ